VTPDANQLTLTAVIAERSALRYTPAGLPALDLLLEHVSQQPEAGQQRQVVARAKAVAFASLAESLQRQPIGSRWCFQGFVATPRTGKHLVFHIQAFHPI